MTDAVVVPFADTPAVRVVDALGLRDALIDALAPREKVAVAELFTVAAVDAVDVMLMLAFAPRLTLALLVELALAYTIDAVADAVPLNADALALALAPLLNVAVGV